LDFSDAAVVLLGHGTTLNENSAAPVYQHAAELRRRNMFAEVQEAFWKQEPKVTEVLSKLTNARVFIVPLFISEGYFSDQVIPRELGFPISTNGRMLGKPDQMLFYCKPIGTHERMTDVILARAREVVGGSPPSQFPEPSETTLFIAGHGTERNENSRKAIERQVELLREKGLYAAIHAVFLEESPRISDCYKLAQTRNIVLVPFFISDGLHTQEDIPVLLGEPEAVVRQRLTAGQPGWQNPTEKAGKRVWYGTAIGTALEVAEVILERVNEAANGGQMT
jgi:sirohydrochlorin cobaltochelatase